MAIYVGLSLATFSTDNLGIEKPIEEVLRVRFMLKDVVYWEEFNDPCAIYKNTNKKITVDIGSDRLVILDTIENFDFLMNKYISPIPFKLN